MEQKFRHPNKAPIIALIMSALAVTIVVMLPFAIYRVDKYVDESRNAEAQATLIQIAKRVIEYARVQGETTNGADLELPPTSDPVPSSLGIMNGTKYLSAPGQWSGTWRLIHFSMDTPMYFQYQWERLAPTQGAVRAAASFNSKGVIDAHFEVVVTCKEGPKGLVCQYDAPKNLISESGWLHFHI